MSELKSAMRNKADIKNCRPMGPAENFVLYEGDPPETRDTAAVTSAAAAAFTPKNFPEIGRPTTTKIGSGDQKGDPFDFSWA